MAVNGATVNTVDDLTFATAPYLATGLTPTGNKNTPTLKADLLSDWREELVFRDSTNRLAIVTTLAPTEYGIRTLMHDPMYRNGVANKNTGYDQMGFASFYLGDEAELPTMRTDIAIPRAPGVETGQVQPDHELHHESLNLAACRLEQEKVNGPARIWFLDPPGLLREATAPS